MRASTAGISCEVSISLDFAFLHSLGWNSFFSSQLDESTDQGLIPARVIAGGRKVIKVQLQPGNPTNAEVSGKFMHDAETTAEFPVVGDWVLCEPADSERVIIRKVMTRKTVLSRKAAGSNNEEQVLSANVDNVFVVTSLNSDFNIARIERYLTMVWMSGATPIVVLTKSDLCDDIPSFVNQVEKLAPDLAVYAISSKTGAGVAELEKFILPGTTSVLLGSSGVGKSTLVNKLFGSSVAGTQDIRHDDHKGRHTTTERNLWHAPSGALLIDTPGMRELQLWDDGSALDLVFSDVEAITLRCKFTNCSHDKEPGCQIQGSLKSGELTRERYASYLKLQGELAAQRRKVDKQFASNEKNKSKKVGVAARDRGIAKRKGLPSS